MRLCKFTLAALLFFGFGCATTHQIPVRPEVSEFKEPAYRMKLFYEYRLNEGDQGWYVPWSKKELFLGKRDLPIFFKNNKDSTAAEWARGANRMDLAGWILGLALESGFIYASAVSSKKEFKAMWAYGLVPAGLLTWSFSWMSKKWFRDPAVTHYNRKLKRELNISPN